MIEKGNLRRPGAPCPAGAANCDDEKPRGGAGGPAAALGAPLQAIIPPVIPPSTPPGVPVSSSGDDCGSGRGPLHIFSRL